MSSKTWAKSAPPSLVDPYLKTERAKEHLDTMRNELRAFDESQPYTFFFEDDVKNGRYRIRVEPKEVPYHIALVAGDFFYSLRSSLDQLVFNLAKLTTPLPKRTQFPILDEFTKETRAAFKRQTAGVSADARDIIESLQPYHGPDTAAIRSRLLWRLNAICNIDKHRRIPVDSTVVHYGFPNFPASLESSIEIEQYNIVSVPLSLKGKMALDPDVSFNIVFGDMNAGVQVTFEGLNRIYDFVANSVIPRFTRFFN